MALRIEPTEGVYVKKSLGIDEEFDEVRVFKVINEGTRKMYLRYPDPATLSGIKIEGSERIRRTPDIEPGGEHLIIVRVKKEYINSLQTVGAYDQFIDFEVVGYAPPPPPEPPEEPTPEYYTLQVLPTDDTVRFEDGTIFLPLTQLEFTLAVSLIAVFSDGTRKKIWPEGGFRFDGNTLTDSAQLNLTSDERVGNDWIVQFENIIGGRFFEQLGVTWTATTRDSSYTNNFGNPVSRTVQIISSEADDEVAPPPGGDGGTDDPTTPPDSDIPTSGGGQRPDEGDDPTGLLPGTGDF